MVKFAAATHPTRVRRDAGEAAPAEGSSLKRDIRRGVIFHVKVMQQTKKATDFLRRCVLFLIGRKAGDILFFSEKIREKS